MADRRHYRIRFQAPQIPSSASIERYFQLSRQSRWFANRGPCHALLEERLAAELGDEVTVVPVANATTGLMVAIRALAGVAQPERRLVITPSFTFVATVSAILWAGFEPLFVDVDPDGWHLDPDSVDAAIDLEGDRIALVMACSTFGTLQPDDLLRRLRSSGARIAAPLLVDSAAGFGSRLPDGRQRGCDGDLDVYSFHATKPFAVGEGGVVVAPSSASAPAIQLASLVNFGFDVRHLVGDQIGLNAKMDEWHCATSLAVLDEFPGVLSARQDRSRAVKNALAPYGYLSQAGSELSSNQFIAVLAPDERTRTRCLQLARDSGIEFREYYRDPLHSLAPLRRFPTMGDLAVTDDLAKRSLSLPLANDLSESDLDEVIGVCIEAATNERA
jgi:dTDP-4-amino-4,6-dideoxygalactose transaminase